MKLQLNCFLAAVALCFAASASAATIEVLFNDINVDYDSSTGVLKDSGPITGDTLSGIDVFLDNVLQGTLGPPDLSVDLNITGVFGIPAGGGVTTSAPGGTLKLFRPGLVLDLTLEAAQVTYLPGTSTIDFVFTNAAGTINGQDIPFIGNLYMDSPVSVTVSTQTSNLQTAGGFVTTFDASGTGEVRGEGVPEPASVVLVGLAVVAFAWRSRRIVAR